MKRVIYVGMVGDLFHHGHVRLLKQAKEMGDYLIVGLISDEVAASYKRAPIMSLQERKEVVEACKYVDEIITPSPLYITKDFIDKYKIDLMIHAHDEQDRSYDEFYKAAISLNKFLRVERTPNISTTDLIERCVNY